MLLVVSGHDPSALFRRGQDGTSRLYLAGSVPGPRTSPQATVYQMIVAIKHRDRACEIHPAVCFLWLPALRRPILKEES